MATGIQPRNQGPPVQGPANGTPKEPNKARLAVMLVVVAVLGAGVAYTLWPDSKKPPADGLDAIPPDQQPQVEQAQPKKDGRPANPDDPPSPGNQLHGGYGG